MVFNKKMIGGYKSYLVFLGSYWDYMELEVDC